ncbi:TPA: 50S ribosomal protein L18, chloroplastic [Trebouxia sp. C0004]
MLAYAPNKWMQNDEAFFGSHTLKQLHSQRFLLVAGCALRIEAAVATRKQRTQKRHKAIRNKVVDDEQQHTLVAASTLMPEIRGQLNGTGGANKEAAVMVGKKIAELCLQKNIEKVCFDRGGNIYHGRVQALAEAAREVGLVF